MDTRPESNPAHEHFEAWFDEYVVGFMLADVSREIAAAQRGENAANFLCAIGLVVYTEALGAHVPGVKHGSKNRFEAFFRRLGTPYAAFLAAHPDTYNVLRNGLVHEYRIKKPASIVMLNDTGSRPVDCGVVYFTAEEEEAADRQLVERDAEWRAFVARLGLPPAQPRWYFVVERYFRDFVVAADRLHRDIVGRRHRLIHMYAPDLLP